jgi:hypothetical protein
MLRKEPVMRPHFPAWSSVLMSVLVPVWLLATPGATWAGPAAHGGGGGGHSSGGGHSGGGSAGHASGGSGGQSGGRATARSDASAAKTSGATGNGTQAESVTTGPHATAGTGQPTAGRAVPRGTVPPPAGGGTTVIVPGYGYGFYPWAFGGLGFGGAYYGGFYDPWYDPFYGSSQYSYAPYPTINGNYLTAPDPTTGSSYATAPDPITSSYSTSDQGAIRIKVKPREAQIYADGYFAGTVDDFDGLFQRLHLRTGPHHIEIRAPGYETLNVDVQIDRNRTITYDGELKRLQ